MRIGVHPVNFDFPDGPESVAPTLAKVDSAVGRLIASSSCDRVKTRPGWELSAVPSDRRQRRFEPEL